MNFGQNLYNWFLSNAQSLVLLAIVVIGLYLGFKREFSKLIGFLVVSLVAVGLVFNADGVKDILLELFNKIMASPNALKSYLSSFLRIIHHLCTFYCSCCNSDRYRKTYYTVVQFLLCVPKIKLCC